METKLRKSFSLDKDIKWELFTDEERELLTECYHDGDYANLTCLPGVAVGTPEREEEFDKMAISLRITTLDSESEVRQELNEFWADPANEMTPEKEAEFQAKIDAEIKEKRSAIEPAIEATEEAHPKNCGCVKCNPAPDVEAKESSEDNKNEAAKLNIENSAIENNKPLINKD